MACLAVLGLLLCADGASPGPPTLVGERVWAGDDVNLWGGPSPDGRWLSAVDAATGGLVLRDLQDGTLQALPSGLGQDSGEFAYFSVFDRSGSRVAYAWFNGLEHYELRVAVLDGAGRLLGEPELLLSNPEIRFVQPCAWSQDGTRVLVLFFRQDNTSQIAIVDADDGEVRVLRSLPWIYPKRMDLSPDGGFLVYDNLSEPDGRERDLYLLRTDGASERRLLSGPTDDQSPVWSHDGRSIWFVSNRGGSQAIWSVAVDSGVVAGSPQRLTKSMARTLLLGATRDGDLFYGRRSGAARLYAQPWDSKASAPVGGPVRMSPGADELDRLLPTFAPDGEHVAYLAQVGHENQGRGHRTVVLQSMDSGRSASLRTRLTFVQAMEFSPDGRQLLLSGSDRRGRSGLFLFDLESERTRPLELLPGARLGGLPGAFAPGGEAVLLAGRDTSTGNSTLVERQLGAADSGRSLLRLPSGSLLTMVSASPHGERLAVGWIDEADPAQATVAVAKLQAGASPAPILRLPGGNLTDLTWAPGGANLLVGTQGRAGAHLWLVSASGAAMTEIRAPADRLPGLSFAPGGTRLAYAAGRTRQEIWVLRNAAPKHP